MLDILTSILKVTLKDFQVANEDYITPTNTSSVSGGFVQGRWFMFDTANPGKIKPVFDEDPGVCFPVWSKAGEPTTQSLQQVSVIFSGSYEAETDQFIDSGLVTGGPLYVSAGKLTGTAGGNSNVVAYVTLLPDSNNNLLRFIVK